MQNGMGNQEQAGGPQTGGGGRSDVRVGMDVIGMDGISIGQVKDPRQHDFLVDRATTRDLYIPYSAVVEANADQVRLNVLSDQVEYQGWQAPHPEGGPGSM